MNKLEALELIKKAWDKKNLSLKDKIDTISEVYYAVGLDVATTATFIKATPAEFDAFLSLSNLNDDIMIEISKANPPKTTWPLLASGNDEEIKKALTALSSSTRIKTKNESFCTFTHRQMIEVAGDTPEQLISQLTGDELWKLKTKAEIFNIRRWDVNFLTSLTRQKNEGRVLSNNQINTLIGVLNRLVDNHVIQRNSIDGDNELCDKVLDAIGK